MTEGTTASSPLHKDIMPVPDMVAHKLKITDSAWVEWMDIKRASVLTVLAVAKFEALREPDQY
jgi:hypothetical protein